MSDASRDYSSPYRTRRAARPRTPAAPLPTVAMGWAAPVEEAACAVPLAEVLAPTKAVVLVPAAVVAAPVSLVVSVEVVGLAVLGEALGVREPPTTVKSVVLPTVVWMVDESVVIVSTMGLVVMGVDVTLPAAPVSWTQSEEISRH